MNGVHTWNMDPAKNLPELGKGSDGPAVGTFMGGDVPTVALILAKDTPDQRVVRLSLEAAAELGTCLIAESERAKFVHPSAQKAGAESEKEQGQ